MRSYTICGYISKIGVLLPIHVGCIGLIIMLMTFYIPKAVAAQMTFYLTFVGRGFFFLFCGGYVLDPFGYTFVGTLIGMGIILIALFYFLIALLNLFDIIVLQLPPPIFQNDCTQTISIALARQKETTDSYQHLGFDETI